MHRPVSTPLRGALVVVFVALLPGAAHAECLYVTGTLRDFTPDTNPDFEYWVADDRGIVQDTLGEDRKPVYNADVEHVTVHDETTFNQWYNDVPGVNLSMPYEMCLWTDDGVRYGFADYTFFPLDGLLFGNYIYGHNYHFTFELHASAAYNGGETFIVAADDDLWLFIDGQLVIDLGGVHPMESAIVRLDDLGLTPGQVYDLDLFFAERMTLGSRLAFETSLLLAQEDCGAAGDEDGDGLSDGDDPDCHVCGDGDVDPGEVCDDGNTLDGDTCSYDCSEGTQPPPNQPPVALCQDLELEAWSTCTAVGLIDAGSYDPDGDSVTLVQSPTTFSLGETLTTLEVVDVDGDSDTCVATVTVVDTSPPVVDCGAPETITPPDAPISFTATATDACDGSVSTVEVLATDCWTVNGAGKIIDKTNSCVVSYSGDTVTIDDSGGVGDIIEWTVQATDSEGNTTEEVCYVEVVNPGNGK